jgi:hypothetical protein
MPDDEVFEYLPTQAIADFLATENEPALDGIIFPSAQASGNALNVVLFHKAAKVEELDIPQGAKIEAHTGSNSEEGWEIDYCVLEKVPPGKMKPPEKLEPFSFPGLLVEPIAYDGDDRRPTLRIDLTSLKVHIVRKIRFECDEYQVSRHRYEDKAPDF